MFFLVLFLKVPLVSVTMSNRDHQREGATLRTLRELRGFKPDQFANLAGISRPYLANMEAGRKPISNVHLARFADLLQVDQIAILRADLTPAQVSA